MKKRNENIFEKHQLRIAGAENKIYDCKFKNPRNGVAPDTLLSKLILIIYFRTIISTVKNGT